MHSTLTLKAPEVSPGCCAGSRLCTQFSSGQTYKLKRKIIPNIEFNTPPKPHPLQLQELWAGSGGLATGGMSLPPCMLVTVPVHPWPNLRVPAIRHTQLGLLLSDFQLRQLRALCPMPGQVLTCTQDAPSCCHCLLMHRWTRPPRQATPSLPRGQPGGRAWLQVLSEPSQRTGSLGPAVPPVWGSGAFA